IKKRAGLRKAFSLLIILFFIHVSTAPLLASQLSKEEKAWLEKRNNTLRFAGQKFYPPFEFIDEYGHYNGIVIELIHWIGVELGFKPTFEPQDFIAAQDAVYSGNADVLTSFFFSHSRDREYDFTKTLFKVPASIYVRQERTDIRSVDDLKRMRVAVQRGDYAITYIISQRFDGNLVMAENFGKGAFSVIKGEADALIGDEQIVDYYRFTYNFQDELKKIGKPLYIGECGMAVKEGQDTLLMILNKGIALAEKKKILPKLNQKWLGATQGYHESFFQKHSSSITVSFLILSILFIVIAAITLRLQKLAQGRSAELESSHLQIQSEIEARLEAMKRLAVSRKSWQDIFNALPEAIFIYDPAIKKILELNESALRLFQTDRNELLKFGLAKLGFETAPYTLERLQALLAQAFINPVSAMQWRCRRNHNESFWAEISLIGTRIDDGLRVLIIVRDVSDRKITEAALERNKLLHKSLMEQTREGFILCNEDGLIIDMNPVAQKMTNLQIKGLPITIWEALPEIIPGGAKVEVKKERLKNLFLQMMRREEIQIKKSYEGRWNALSGTLYFQANLYPIQLPEEKIMVVTLIDRTLQVIAEMERKKTQAANRNREKMESLGMLAGGVAHEINNPLTGIINYAQLIKDLCDDKTLINYADGIINEGNRVANTVKSLLRFSKQDEETREILEISKIISETMQLIGSILKKDDIIIITDVPENLPKISGNSQQIEQVLINLLTNAREALNHKYPAYDPNKIISLRAALEEREGKQELLIKIRDNGDGIPEEIRDRVFDPFFTTKGNRSGAGLGLAICENIIKEHNGSIDLHSQTGQFSEFIIRLQVS
ncbi:MAG TPA: transporter substrate-binding domain-containing protein, partial [Candidatus Marinimicrobia bacterium]|nr:transporter substrate-binding domain-containing protein [Candidatus Neomarinimicrobiota bacterium]